MICRISLIVMMLIAPVAALAQSPVFIVRHAERADAGTKPPPGADPDLSAAGRTRAENLAAMLKDARIGRIFITEFKRTRQTAEPLAKLLGIEPTVITQKEGLALVQRVKSATGPVLVVGHSNTVPEVIKALGVSEAVTVEETEFDNLFVIVPGSTPSLLRLHYR